MAASIASGRLFSQVLRLVKSADLHPALILEGTSADWPDGGLHREAVRRAMVTLTLLLGLPVLRARTPVETVSVLRYAATQARTAGRNALRRPGRRPRGKAAVQQRILQTLPGVGPARAARLLQYFGSVRAVMAADESALREVNGIGREVAEHIRWAVRELPAAYDGRPCTASRRLQLRWRDRGSSLPH